MGGRPLVWIGSLAMSPQPWLEPFERGLSLSAAVLSLSVLASALRTRCAAQSVTLSPFILIQDPCGPLRWWATSALLSQMPETSRDWKGKKLNRSYPWPFSKFETENDVFRWDSKNTAPIAGGPCGDGKGRS